MILNVELIFNIYLNNWREWEKIEKHIMILHFDDPRWPVRHRLKDIKIDSQFGHVDKLRLAEMVLQFQPTWQFFHKTLGKTVAVQPHAIATFSELTPVPPVDRSWS